MNQREAIKQGLRLARSFASNREEAKKFIKTEKGKYKVRIILLTTSQSGFNAYIFYEAYAEEMYFNYKIVENFESVKLKLQQKIKNIKEDYNIAIEKEERLLYNEIVLFDKAKNAIYEKDNKLKE